MKLLNILILLIIIITIPFNASAMNVGDFIHYRAMLMSANDPKSPLTQSERDKIHSLEKMSNLTLGGMIDGIISFNDIATVKGNSKIICYPEGQPLDVARISDDLADYYDHQDQKKRASLASLRFGYFVAAFLVKTFPCK
ncbi:TPA: hypothetical protein MD340_005223 [Klebsiella pneumoniae]|nr:hypothetical protein [Klebsiella variicola]ELA2262080.1 hypothetical protein [Klebsiella pneumoniae]ELA2282975.1 hypothetical protein [Klebsiella pneumoniae]ELA2315222.1 hypothetical protein [Klebsiella pneumoniae]PCO65537.1 hypothetical protein CQA02_28855 [Klebsiella variicola]HBT0452376.1 hypothetical protein [Klebsiella pneumoniae]